MTTHSNSDTISTLNTLIETCRDGEQGFRSASERASGVDLKQLFSTLAFQRSTFKHELETHVERLGGKPADLGHAAGVVHRGWMAVKAGVSSDGDGALLDECERGEEFADKAYAKALDQALPSEIRTLVGRQASEVKASHARMTQQQQESTAGVAS